MARKHPNPLEDPPAASSSGEEEEEEEVEEEEYEEVEEEVEEEEEDVPNGNRDGSDDGEEEEEEEVEEEVEEEDEEEVEEYDNEEEDKEEVMTEKSNPQSPKSKPVSKNPNSRERDDDDDEETESDSGSGSPGVSGFTIKKHVSRPAIDSPNSSAFVKPKRSAAKTATDKESRSPVLVSMKRPAEADVEIGQKDSKSSAKKPKSENGGDEGLTSEKKFFINRLWNEEREIAILKGMIEFHEKRGVDPNSDSTAFHEFVKDKLSVEVSKSQVMEKVRRLKKKYKNNVGKGENGEDPVFSRPHELKSFELSKKIWGGVDIQNKRSSAKKKSGSGNAKPDTEIGKDNGNAGFATSLQKDEPLVAVNNKEEQGQVQEEKFSQLYPFLNLSLRKNNFSADLISKEGAEAMMGSLRRLEKSQLEELDEEWRKQILAEADLCTRRSALLQKQVQLISDWNARRG